jgi:hypothetical protein
MTLDEYRAQILAEINALRNENAARQLIRDVPVNLQKNEISANSQQLFWQQLNSDLDRASIKARTLVEKQAADSLSDVIAGAQAVIAQHQQRTSAK